MPLSVSDRGSNKNELIEHAAEVLGRSTHKTSVFSAIYRGKKKTKTVIELMAATNLSRQRVLDAGKTLDSQDLVEQVKVNGVTAYKKIAFFQAHRNRIIRLARNAEARKRLPTKRRPARGRGKETRVRIDVVLPRKRIQSEFISIDNIESFAKVNAVPQNGGYTKLSEAKFKRGVAKILGEKGSFKDWGGENRDLSSTRVTLNSKRRPTTFAFKGPGTKGKLTPAKMGKNGDQIQRLLKCPAEIFLVQYWGQIDDSVLDQLENFARLKSYLEDRRIWYGMIDGVDSTRLINAYSEAFNT